MSLKKTDISILRKLAEEYAQYATLPEQKERRRLWTALNMGHMERPLVLIDQLPWIEMDVDGFLRCEIEDPYWGEVEDRLRKTIYKWRYLRGDMVLNPYITLYVPVIETGWGIGISEHQLATEEGNDVVSHQYINQFQTIDDLEKLKTPTARRDREQEKLIRQQADQIFEGIIPYRMCGAAGELYGFRVGPWDWITQWMGVTDAYIAMMDEPELIHALMEKTTDGIVSLIGDYNREGLFDIETNLVHCSQTFSEDLPHANCDRSFPQSQDAWGFSMAQLMTSVSPEFTREFEANYANKTFPLMGAVYYGCCERLDDRMDIIASMPNIRKISCSPWSDREHFAEVMPDRYVMSNKPSPAILSTDVFDLEAARSDVRRTMLAAKTHGKRLELIMKDVSTLRHEPQRIYQWAQMAVEEAKRSAE